MTESLLKVDDLTLELDRHHGGATVVDRVSFNVAAGSALGIVGESGSGKSLTLRAAMGLLPAAVQGRSGQPQYPAAGGGVGLPAPRGPGAAGQPQLRRRAARLLGPRRAPPAPPRA